MFTDEIKIKVKAGNGGKGAVSFRREKYVPKGGPDGGDGGKGGDVIFKVNNNVNTLTLFNTKKNFEAENGVNGSGNRSTGRKGENLILEIPQGTIIFHEIANKETMFADLIKINQEVVVARGGIGGRGNIHFATATHQTPMEAEAGKPGQEKILRLELRLIADVGLIGLPNSGKSTLLARISQAKPKIANYPFTTLEPNLGVVKVDDQFSLVVADIPGLIQGASQGRGLGHKFLRHIKRTKILVHLIDCNNIDPIKCYQEIRAELKDFSPELMKKPEIVVITKVDSLSEKNQRQLFAKVRKLNPIFLSSQSGRGINDLLYKIKEELN